MSIKFGTDGWRAVIADTFTFENLERVAQATADYWKQNKVKGTEKHIVVGYDRRFLSDKFAERTAFRPPPSPGGSRPSRLSGES
jgi:phosphomannomutase